MSNYNLNCIYNKFLHMIFFLFLIVAIAFVGFSVLLNVIKIQTKSKNLKVAFFHPFCNDGGGGEKVLWCMINTFLKSEVRNSIQIAIYSLQKDKDQILSKNRFSVDLSQFSDKITIIFAPGKNLLIPQKKLTMIFHMFLPLIYLIKCLIKYQPDVFYDTTGFASTLFLTKILLPTTKTAAYVHYPFISLDMIQKVKQRRSDFNNDDSISKSLLKTKLKLLYYQTIFWLYKINGIFVDFAQTNSSWTHNHMKQIWKSLEKKNKLKKLYPPCSVQQLLKFQKDTSSKKIIMMSLAQFRPEKNHKCQINILKRIIQAVQKQKLNLDIQFYICGTTRGLDDQNILKQLQNYSAQLGLQKIIDFKVNKPFVQILKYLNESLIGIHTMQAEHFGISVVEMLAAGLIVVAHNSAGPKEDIIKDQNFLAQSQQDYYSKIIRILKSNSSQKQKWIAQNRVKAEKFGEKAFEDSLNELIEIQLGQKIKRN